MDTDFQQRNSQNMQALISYVRDMPNPTTNSIEYKQAHQMVLLGKGHSARDIKRVDEAVGDWTYGGRIAIRLDKTKKPSQKTETKLIVRITPDVKGGMSELETAIQAAVAGTDEAGTPIEFSWA